MFAKVITPEESQQKETETCILQGNSPNGRCLFVGSNPNGICFSGTAARDRSER